MPSDVSGPKADSLVAENEKLKRSLLLAIPWIGESMEGPAWATPEAKQKNRAMCERAIEAAMACFPAPENGEPC